MSRNADSARSQSPLAAGHSLMLSSVARGYGGGRRVPDAGELVGIVLLGIIGLWGVWFGVQSVIALWWPLNLAYGLAGAIVAVISAAVAWALLNR